MQILIKSNNSIIPCFLLPFAIDWVRVCHYLFTESKKVTIRGLCNVAIHYIKCLGPLSGDPTDLPLHNFVKFCCRHSHCKARNKIFVHVYDFNFNFYNKYGQKWFTHFLYQYNMAKLLTHFCISAISHHFLCQWQFENFTQKVSKWYWNISCWTQNECIYNLHAKFWPSFFLFGSRKLAVSNNDHAHVHNQYLAIRGRSCPYCFWPSLSSCLEFLSALSWQPCSLSGSACLHTCCRLSQENQSGHALPIRKKPTKSMSEHQHNENKTLFSNLWFLCSYSKTLSQSDFW